MDDEDFDDLLGGAEMLQDSSQESLTYAAANLTFDYDNTVEEPRHSPATSISTQDVDMLKGPGILTHETSPNAHEQSQSEDMSVIEKIEAVFEAMADAMLQDKTELAITMRVRQKPSPDQNASTSDGSKVRRLRFPGKTAEEAWRFTVVLRILELVYQALRSGVVLSKRDIYYRDPALFNKQATVDRYVDDIAFTFGVTRSALNITAVAKGLVAGAVKFCRRDGSDIDAASDKEGILVPNLIDVLSVNMAAVKWILVIEKEATFRSIAASSFWPTISTEGVILTGKGYPDIASRALLHFLSTPSPRNGFASPPVYGLADFDPDGLAILSIYKNGSQALSHESADLVAPSMRWLGLRNEHMLLGGDSLHATQGLLTLTPRDRRKAIKMLERCESDDRDDFAVAEALQTMLMLNTKAELQLLDAVPDGMANLLKSTLCDL